MKYKRLQTVTISLTVYTFLGFVTICLFFILGRIIISWDYYLYGFIATGFLSAAYLYRELLLEMIFLTMSLIWVIPMIILTFIYYPFRENLIRYEYEIKKNRDKL